MIVALIAISILSIVTMAILFLVVNLRKNKPAWSDSDTEVIYTNWHTLRHSGFLDDDVRNAKYLLSIKGDYVQDNVIFEWEYRGDTPFVRAKVIFKKKSDNDEHN